MNVFKICILYYYYRVYTSITPYQEITTKALYMLYNRITNPIIIYNSDDSYKSRIDLLKSIYNDLDSNIYYEYPINIDKYEDSIIKTVTEMRIRILNSKNIIILLQYTQLEYFLEQFYERICKINGYNNAKECYSIYNMYVIDSTHLKFNPIHSEGINVLTQIINDNSDISNEYFDKIKEIGGDDYYPGFYDALIPLSTKLLLKVLSDSSSFSINDFRNVLYTSSVDTMFGLLQVDEENHISKIMYHAIVNSNGDVEYYKTISKIWSTHTYRLDFNIEEYKVCNWKTREGDDIIKDSIKIGIITPTNPNIFKQTTVFLSAIFTSIRDINKEGGILNNYIITYNFADGNSPEIVTERMKKAYEKGITIFIGGYTYLFFIIIM